MTLRSANDTIPMQPATLPASEFVHRPFLIVSLCMATLIGFVLGIHVPLGRLLNSASPERTLDLLQAHGQVQLLGFAGLFIAGVALRLMPRFAGARITFPFLVPATLWLFATGLLLRALVLPWLSGDAHAAVLITASFVLLGGAACFVLVVCGTLIGNARRFEATSLAFVFGALQLFAATTVATFATIAAVNDGLIRLPYLANTAVLHLMLFGFVVSFILGVGLRAIPTMLAIARPERSAMLLSVALCAASALLALSLLYLEYVAFSQGIVLLADIAFLGLGLVLVSLVWQAGTLRRVVNRLRPASQPHLWLVRSAFVWMVFAGVSTCYFAVSALFDARLPAEFHFDAVRHTLGAGVVTMLITGMAMMILPEFAMERMGPNRQRTLALVLAVLLNVATALRVLPSLAGLDWSFDDRNLSMALAGTLAEVALLLFAAYFFRLIWRARKTGGDRIAL